MNLSSINLSLGRGGTSLSQQVSSILRKYGTDAHVYLPGIGVINGLTAGNFLDSAGKTAATVDNPVGLVLDAAGSVGLELVTNGTFDSDVTGWAEALGVGATLTWSSGAAVITSGSSGARAYQVISTVIGKTYKLEISKTGGTTNVSGYRVTTDATGGATGQIVAETTLAGNWSRSLYFVATATSTTIAFTNSGAVGLTSIVDNISVKEVTGIHALQATTANKPILRYASGRYYFDFVDGTDVLNATYPAGWESVTTIDAAPTGQVTLTAQNIVGTYAITTDTYGRFVFKTITASELAIVQSFCNRLAGV